MILGELPLREGKASVRGVISYASQEPWLFTGSVRQNVLFDSPMNDERYEQVIKSCGLQRDFERFPRGDKTVVGERGVTLSGGQKARINLARAVYKEADIYLLDDPLSAVDSRVGKHLFEKCIKGYLRNKITILTTHQIHFLTNEEKIVLMKKAKIVAEASYQELLASGVDFDEIHGSTDETIVETNFVGKSGSSNDNVSVLGSSNECVVEQLSVDESRLHGDKRKPNEVNETKCSGNVSKRVYSSYVSAFGSSFVIFLFFAMYTITQVLITAGDFWITFWVNQEDYVFQNNNHTSNDEITSIDNFPTMSLNYRQTFILVFVALNVLLLIAIIVRSALFVTVCTRASYNLHDMMLNAVIRAKMLFFHANSSGRILNRFSNDMGAVDEHLPNLLLEVFQMGFRILGIIFVIGLVDIYLLIPTVIMGVFCYYIRSFYLSTSRSIKRLEGIARSPVLGHMNASVQGLTTIRAYKAERTVYHEFDKHQDFHSSAWYLFICSNGALGLWMDMASIAFIAVIIFSFVAFNDYTYGGYVGLVITQSIGLVGLLQWAIRQSTMVENQMISVERVFEYANCPKEADFQCPSDKKLPNGWPGSGRIVFKNFNLKYSQNSPYVLKNLNIEIRPKEKIGIVGRTGAGKSSIIKALFRLATNEGEIIIDDIEIHELGLHVLRSKLSVIPQEPILYSGTMRYNLDLFDEFSDHVLWNALDEVNLKTTIENLPDGLTTKISESGSNFSVGQKQLICLARALVRNNGILILDEATANIDAQTDALIQNTIRKKFHGSTVITVAHRLNTVVDSDRVLVMDAGSVIEFDHPHVLLRNKDGLFYSMVEQTGPTTSALIRSAAAESFNTTHNEDVSPGENVD